MMMVGLSVQISLLYALFGGTSVSVTGAILLLPDLNSSKHNGTAKMVTFASKQRGQPLGASPGKYTRLLEALDQIDDVTSEIDGITTETDAVTTQTDEEVDMVPTKVGHRVRRKATKKPQKKRRRKTRRGKQKKKRVRALHCVPDLKRLSNMTRGECKGMWDASVCGNKTMTTLTANYVLPFWTFPEADILSKAPPELTPKVMILSLGTMIVEATGLYQLYAQVLFLDNWFRSSVSIVVNNNRAFKCVHEFGHGVPRGVDDKVFNTCSVMAVAFLHKNDNITVVIPYRQSNLDLHGDSTYFGVISLSA